jgi:DNA-binding NarL/FixJ family response regulator
VRALIVDDEPLARRGVILRLRRFKDVEVVGECGDGASACHREGLDESASNPPNRVAGNLLTNLKRQQ